MISKADVTSWFQTLESYKRIDVMCALLNICLPFELRFLGTCLEELGRRDSQELRGMELRVNNPQAVASDMHACQHSEPTDRKVRRKMALYLALIRACNRTCVNEIFRSLESWGELDFSTTVDKDTLQELLLVYTMAAHHPVFDFEQHMKCMQIFEKIKEHKLVVDPVPLELTPPNQISSSLNSGLSSVNSGLASELHITQHQHTTQSQADFMHQNVNVLQAASIQQTNTHPHLLNHNHVQMLPQGPIPLNYQQNHVTKLISGADGINIQQSMGVESIPHMISSNITIPENNKSATNAVITHSNTTAWTVRQYPPPPLLTDGHTIMDHQNLSASPLVSQQSSPCSSRPTSPNRTSSCDNVILHNQTTNHVRNLPSQRMGSTTVKNIRRPSVETTPPPSLVQQHSPIMPNELIVSQNVKQITEVVVNNETPGNPLQNLIRNGFSRSSNYIRVKSGNYIPSHQQQQSPVNQHYSGPFSVNAGLAFGMHNMSMSDMTTSSAHQMEVNTILGMNSNKSTGSDSGSSIGSSGELSPPETPTLMMNNTSVSNTAVMRLNTGSGDNQSSSSQQHPQHQPQKLLQPSQLSYNKQLGLSRLSGRSEKIIGVNAVGAASNPNPAIIYAQQQQQSQVLQQTTTPQAMYADVLLTPGGNGSTATVIQGSLTSNSCAVNNSNVVSSNNNMLGTNTVLISSPSGGGATNISNVITSNSLLLQTHQQQYNTTYSYHAAAAAAAAQHLMASSARPPLMTHNPAMAPPPHGTFRLPGFQLQPNGELYYQTFHPAGGIAFLSGGSPPGGPPLALRTTNNGAAVASAPTATQPPTPQHIPPPSQLPTTPTAASILASPYGTLTIGLSNKPMSCYNCGSQTHSGRECQEASMDDVTRSAIYKLDYSQAASGAGAGNISAGNNNVGINTQVSTSSSEATPMLHATKLHDSNSLNISNTSAVATATSLVASVLTTTASVNAK